MIKRTFAIVALIGLAAGCSTQSMEDLGGKPSPNLRDGDNNFFKTITIANETEIQSSQLAMNQAQDPMVKDFAQRMISDHKMAENKVSFVAQSKGVTLPTALDATHQQMIDDLKSKSGKDFDQAYETLQVDAHKQTIASDQDEIDNGTDPDVKSLAAGLMDTLKMHLSMAQKLQNGSYSGM